MSRCGLCCAGSSRVQQPSTSLAVPLGEAEPQQRFPHCACNPAGLAVPYKGRVSHCRRQLPEAPGGDGCPAQWDSRGQVHSSLGCKEVALCWDTKCLAMAAAHGCACQLPLQGCRELPHVPIHATPHHPRGAQASLLTFLVGVSFSLDGDGHFPPRAWKQG